MQVSQPAPKAGLYGYPSAVASEEASQPRLYAFATDENSRLYVNYWNGA